MRFDTIPQITLQLEKVKAWILYNLELIQIYSLFN